MNFFETAPRDQYRVLVHCKLPSCKDSLDGTILQTVPRVKSWYCTDLVSPMNQLLRAALQQKGNSRDKFAFVSDSTLPAKPFGYLYRELIGRRGSDFCVFPSQEWASIRAHGGIEVAPKHHQWIILDRRHAEES